MGFSDHFDKRLARVLSGIILYLAAPVTACQAMAQATRDSDHFFLTLIQSSLARSMPGDDGTGDLADRAALSALTNPTQPSPVANNPVIIPLPALDPPAVKPAADTALLHHRWVVLELTAGIISAGGYAEIAIGDISPHGDGEADGYDQDQNGDIRIQIIRPLNQSEALIAKGIDHWPIGPVHAPLDMQMICGACGDTGTTQRFSGSASLELDLTTPNASMIRDIDLRTVAGLSAAGGMTFVAEQPSVDGHLVDYQASLRLTIDGVITVFDTHLEIWRQARTPSLNSQPHTQFGNERPDDHQTAFKEIFAGAFAATPTFDHPQAGSVIGYFSEAGCAPPCGLAN